jgi:regulator of protease activity HflC (stomatin/prohibitin superfamily)
MKLNNLLAACGAVAMAIALSACGQTVQPGDVGIKISKYAAGPNGGVDPEALPSGWHALGWGEYLVQYPTIERTYAFTREKGDGGQANEEITFSDRTGLPVSGDVNVTLRVLPEATPKLYKTWRLNFDQLLFTPIRNDVRSAIARQAELMPVDQMYNGGRELIVSKALAEVQTKWAPQGVQVSSLQWIGNLRYPDQIVNSIMQKSKIEQDTLAAQARVQQAKADADARIEQARGEAESTKLRAEALSNNPQVLRQEEIAKWNGRGCPLDAKTCIIGGNALQQITGE